METRRPAVEVGDRVAVAGRECVLLGVDPMSLPERLAHVERLDDGVVLRVPLEALRPVDPPSAA